MGSSAADRGVARAGESSDPQTFIVAVHGVGPAGPGDILGVLLPRTSLQEEEASLDHLLVRGVPYPRAKTGDKVLLEVPWADLRPVVTGRLSLIAEVVAVLTAMVQAAIELPATKLSLPLARAYKAVLFAAGVWCLWPPVMLLLVQLQPGTLQQVFIAVAVVVAVLMLGFWLRLAWCTDRLAGWS